MLALIPEHFCQVVHARQRIWNEGKFRTNYDLTAIESSLKQLSISIWEEVNDASKRKLEQLFEKM